MNDKLSYSKRGLALTESFEGFRANAYQDIGKVWTIGYGHTGNDVTPTTVITQAQAEALLAADVRWAEFAVKKFVTVTLDQDEFDALVGFVFNCGAGNFKASTLLKKVNSSDFVGVAAEFRRWDRVAGAENKGLARRRLSESELFTHVLQEATCP
jgi:lysozyme